MADGLTCWVDASAGIAGDMLLGALLDAGAALDAVRAAVDAVAPGEVTVDAERVLRHGMRATKAHVRSVHGAVADQGAADHEHGHLHRHGHPHGHDRAHPHGHDHHPGHEHRAWADIEAMLRSADLPEPVRERALGVFGAIAVAEARAHGVAVADVHFHEVGAWDSIADVVGTCAALHDLGVERLVVGELAVGSGTVRMAHGELAVPGPAVAELSRGLLVRPGPARTELATPTGVALLTGASQGPLPVMRVVATGTGAGTKDFDSHANVVRVVLGDVPAEDAGAVAGAPASGPQEEALATVPLHAGGTHHLVVLEATVDDLDPRLWPGVIDMLLAAGAKDVWLVPAVVKKGRPAQVVSVLTDRPAEHRRLLFLHTSTLGVREHPVTRTALEREWRTVDVDGHPVAVKLGLLDGEVVTVQPEFRDVQALATARGTTEAEALRRATAAAAHLG